MMKDPKKSRWWINRDVLLLNLSAFFADMGYQAIIAGFPVFLVLVLGAPAYFLGIAYALAYGIGAAFGTIGGILGDYLGRKKIAILGNSFILALPLLSIAASAAQALAIFSGGWWARDFRTSSRRAMLSDSTTKPERPRAFGMLHAFDIGGGVIAVTYLLVLIGLKLNLQSIFALTAIPIALSTICLVFVRARKRKKMAAEPQKPAKKTAKQKQRAGALKGVLIATALFGFSFYSLGFPIITIASQSGNYALGILSYLVYLLFSAAAGYVIGMYAARMNMVKGLSMLGYLLAAIASLLLAAYYAIQLPTAVSYAAVALLGMAVGSIETFEPTIISLISPRAEQGRKLGYLTSSRGIGLFTANAAMGLLYSVSPAYSYVYAAIVASAAVVILLHFGRNFIN